MDGEGQRLQVLLHMAEAPRQALKQAGEDISTRQPTELSSRFGVNQDRCSQPRLRSESTLNNLFCTTDRMRREPLEQERCAAARFKAEDILWNRQTLRSLSAHCRRGQTTMLVHMSNTNITINILLEEALNEPDIGTTADSVGMPQRWALRHYVLGSAAPSTPPFEDALKEGLTWGSISAERNENFTKLNKDWSCFSFVKSK